MFSSRWQTRGRVGVSYGRGGRGGWSQRQHAPAPEVSIAPPPPPLGNLVQMLKTEELDGAAQDLKGVAKITKRSLVASFNWLDGDNSTILVPGRPPRWSPLSEPIEIPDDNSKYGNRHFKSSRKEFRDQNAARSPKHPMEPAVLATLAMYPNLCSEQMLDVLACGSTLGNLFRFVTRQDKPFRILVEKVGSTMFLTRRENSPTELIPDIQGYGHSFPEHYTNWDREVKGSKSHQRIVRYRFGSMNFLMRFEGDGYIAKTPALEKSPRSSHVKASEASSVDELADSLLQTLKSTGPNFLDGKLKAKLCGDLIEQDLVFDLKTRSNKKIDQVDKMIDWELPRLWLAGIPKLILAFHDRGVFDDIRIMEMGNKIKDWEAANQEPLAKLAALIHHIRTIVRGRPDGKLELRHSEAGVLEVREQLPDAGDALSPTVKAMWLESTLHSDSDDNESETSGDGGVLGVESDGEEDKDFTACSADTCGYCGHCSY